MHEGRRTVPIGLVLLAILLPSGVLREPVAGRTPTFRCSTGGCKPAAPIALWVDVEPLGGGEARIRVEAVARFDAERLELRIELPDGVQADGSIASSTSLRAGEPLARAARLTISPALSGARVRVTARMAFRAPDDPSALEQAGAESVVVLGDPPDETPGRRVAVDGVPTMELPSVVLR